MQAEDTYLLFLTSGSCKCRKIVIIKLNIMALSPFSRLSSSRSLTLYPGSAWHIPCKCQDKSMSWRPIGRTFWLPAKIHHVILTIHPCRERKWLLLCCARWRADLKVSVLVVTYKVDGCRQRPLLSTPETQRHPHLPGVLLTSWAALISAYSSHSSILTQGKLAPRKLPARI